MHLPNAAHLKIFCKVLTPFESMCTSPLLIQNKGIRHYAGRFFNQVPCGKCESCRRVKSIDYFLRAFAIYANMPDNWSVFFCNFTYRPDDVPKTDFYVFNDGWKLYSSNNLCFNHEHIMRFMKSYRQFYRRMGFVDDDLPKMLFTSEFGEDENSTHRPHYHGIVFIPRNLEWYQFKKEVERYWHYGFTKNIKLHRSPDLVNDRSDVNCFKYVTKYVAKGSGYMPVWSKYNHYTFIPSLDDWYRIEPRVHCTNGFGKELERILRPRNYEINSVTLSVDGSVQTFAIPNYYRRRFYTSSFLLEKFPNDNVPTYPFRVIQRKPYKHYIKRQITLHQNNYDSVQSDQLKESLSVKFQKALHLFQSGGVNLDVFLDSKTENREDLVTSLLSCGKDDFIRGFFLFNWSEHPVTSFEYKSVDYRDIWHKRGDSFLQIWNFTRLARSDIWSFPLKSLNYLLYRQMYYIGDKGKQVLICPDKLQNTDNVYKYPDLYNTFMSAFHALSVYDDYLHYVTLRKQEIDKQNEQRWYNLHGLKNIS